MSFTLKTKDFRERSFTLCVLSSKRFAWLVALKQENPHVTRNVRVCKVLYKWGLCEGNRTRNQKPGPETGSENKFTFDLEQLAG